MGKWAEVGKFGLNIGLGFLGSKGVPVDQMIKRSPRRRRRRGSPDYTEIARGIRDVLKGELRDDELEEVDFVTVELARLVLVDRQPEEEEEIELIEDPPPRRKRRKRTTKKKTKKK